MWKMKITIKRDPKSREECKMCLKALNGGSRDHACGGKSVVPHMLNLSLVVDYVYQFILVYVLKKKYRLNLGMICRLEISTHCTKYTNLHFIGLFMVNMDDPNITMEQYIQLEEEKARRRGQVYNRKTATYGKIWLVNYFDYFKDFEKEFPAIAYNDALTSDFSPEPTVLIRRILGYGYGVLTS
nr:hypothetical protein [Tanacetum cinerariifolium]